MNQGRIWCVVNPTIGLPLFLGSVTLISITVHATVLGNTTWMKGYFQGGKTTTAAVVTPEASRLASASAAGYTVKAAPNMASSAVIDAKPAPADQAVASAAPGSSPPSG